MTIARRRFCVCVLGLLPAVAGCGGGDGGTGPGVSYVGGWTGTTSQGLLLNFYVEQNGIPLVVVHFTLTGTSCNQNLISFLSREGTEIPFAVTGTTLTAQSSGSGGSIDITGTFDATGTTASGTLVVNSTSCGGTTNATWTATKAAGPGVNLTGNWTGTSQSSVASQTDITFQLAQSGQTVSGTYSTTAGGDGTVSGSVSGTLFRFTLTQTTPGCTGSFTGHGIVIPTPTEFLQFNFAGNDCLGTHANGGGTADR